VQNVRTKLAKTCQRAWLHQDKVFSLHPVGMKSQKLLWFVSERLEMKAGIRITTAS